MRDTLTSPQTTTYPDLTQAKVLADSVWHYNGRTFRLSTIQATFPRFILAEFNTHRQFSRNSASSRAIPTARQLELIEKTPFVPQKFPVNQPGMSATSYITPDNDPEQYGACLDTWIGARDDAVQACRELGSVYGVHKQIANRLIEPFMWHTVIASATWEEGDWPNFFSLRISEHAQPEIDTAARVIKAALDISVPRDVTDLPSDEAWHLPLLGADGDEDLTLDQKVRVSVARVAAVSFNRHDRVDVDKELDRYCKLAENRHLSPFEHVAHPWWSVTTPRSGNFMGWKQVRWYIEHDMPLPTP